MPNQNNSGVDRRTFLTRAALGGVAIVGASALGGIDADAAFASPIRPLDHGVSKATFVEGRVAARNGDLLSLAGSYGDTHHVQITNATSVWKLHPTDAGAIDAGDGMYVRGVRMPDGSVAADAVWVNIVNLVGDVAGMGRDRIHLRHGRHTVVGRIVLGTTVASFAGRAPTSDLTELRIGHSAQILGAWRPDDDSIDVARISTGH